ncbi:MAG: HDOD domain-containing protein, partial [Kofleriaceae bacterium]
MTALAELERALIARLAANKIKIPPYPAIATKLERLAREPRCTLNDLVTVVSADPSLAAAVLARASSAANRSAKVATLFDALSRIGIQQLIEMALATGLGQSAVAAGPLAELRRDNWRRALLGAHLARMLAGNRGVAGEVAYLGGLLHELGAVIAVQGLEDLARDRPLPALTGAEWRAFVRGLEGAFGAVVATRWKLPQPIAEVIAHAGAHSALAELIRLVGQVVDRLDDCPTAGIAGLVELPELSEIERCSIGSVVQEVVKSMTSYARPAAASSQIAPPPSRPQTFPVSFPVSQDQRTGARAKEISTEILVVESPE